MDTSVIQSLSNGLDFGSARMQAISNNLSNVSTPGYRRKDVSFDALLNSITGDDDALAQRRTDPRHLSLDSGDASGNPTPNIQDQPGGAMRADGNTVDIDAESSRLAAAEIYYQGVSQLLQGQFSNMKYVIAGGR